jgi:PGF-pre-PGF domain-containing protein
MEGNEMKNKGLITLLCIFALAFPALGATVTIGSYTVAPGGSVVAPLIASGVTNLGAVTVNLTFDPMIVHVTSVDNATGNAMGLVVANIDNSTGLVQVSSIDIGGKSGDVIIANLALDAVGAAGTSSPLNIEIVTFTDAITSATIPATSVSGTFTITSSGTPGGTPGNSGSSGSSGGGGGGGTSSEDFSNIIVKEKYDMFIFKDKVTSYAFSNQSNPIQYVNITGNISAGEINTAVEVLKTNSSLVKNIAPGTVYKNVNIWVGTTGFAVPKNIKEGDIEFKVENSWLDSNNLARGDVRMVKWDGSQWIQLETVEKMRNDTYTWFEAKTHSFSPFAITGLKGGVIVPTATPPGAVTETQAVPTETGAAPPVRKVPGFEFVLTIAILSVAYLLGRMRR